MTLQQENWLISLRADIEKLAPNQKTFVGQPDDRTAVSTYEGMTYAEAAKLWVKERHTEWLVAAQDALFNNGLEVPFDLETDPSLRSAWEDGMSVGAMLEARLAATGVANPEADASNEVDDEVYITPEPTGEVEFIVRLSNSGFELRQPEHRFEEGKDQSLVLTVDDYEDLPGSRRHIRLSRDDIHVLAHLLGNAF